MSRLAFASIILACLVVVAGCSGGPAVDPNRPATVDAGGTVTYNGQPLEGATVAFLPKTPTDPGASGRTDAAGKFKLTAFAPGDGAVPGSYLVTISKVEGSSEVQEDSEAAPVIPKSLIPEEVQQPPRLRFHRRRCRRQRKPVHLRSD